jgi:hypothetical protein
MTDAVTRAEFDLLKGEVKTNTKLTQEIHDMVRSFKIVAAVAKWITTISAGLAVIWHGIKTWLPHHP